VREGLPHATGG